MRKRFAYIVIMTAMLTAFCCGTKQEASLSGAMSHVDSATQRVDAKQTDGLPESMEDDLLTDDSTDGLKKLTDEQKERRKKLEKETAERAAKRKLLIDERARTSPTFKDKDGNVVYNKAEIDPSFEGGEKALKKYLRKNLDYPDDAEEQGVEGTVFVDFVIAKDGRVREIEVTDITNDDVSQSLRREAVRVISAMPRWVPGQQHGQPVDVKYSLPITFRLL